MVNDKSKRYLISMPWRQIVSTKGNSLSSMTVISILGVTIGIAALVVVLSVMGGLENDLKSKMFRGLPHIEILNNNSVLGFSLKENPLSRFQDEFPNIVGIEAFSKSDVVLKKNKNLASVTLFGIDPESGGKLWGFSEGMILGEIKDIKSDVQNNNGDFAKIILGEGLSVQLNAEVGDVVEILNPQVNVSGVLGGQKISTKFKVTGIFMTDLPHFDSQYAVVDLVNGRKFMPDYDSSLDEDEFVTGIAINILKPEDIEFSSKNYGDNDDLQIQTWKSVNHSLLIALKLEKFTMGAILLLVVLVAAFSISGTMMITVYHKRSQVALLRSLGMEQDDISKLFLIQGLTIGTIGVVFGLAIGLSICLFLQNFKFLENLLELAFEGGYFQTKLPVKFLPLEYAVISLCAWVLSLLAAVYPARVASKEDPGNGLRCL